MVAADDLDGAVHAKKRKRSEEARQAQHMIEMSTRQQHVRHAPKPEPRAHQLLLGTLTAIDQVPAGALCNKQCR